MSLTLPYSYSIFSYVCLCRCMINLLRKKGLTNRLWLSWISINPARTTIDCRRVFEFTFSDVWRLFFVIACMWCVTIYCCERSVCIYVCTVFEWERQRSIYSVSTAWMSLFIQCIRLMLYNCFRPVYSRLYAFACVHFDSIMTIFPHTY